MHPPATHSSVPRIRLEWPRALLMVVATAMVLHYLWWRAGTLNAEAPVFSGILYAAELYGLLTLLLHLFMTWRLSVRVPPAVPPGRKVDVFIPTYNESLAVIRHTALAALAIDYPHETWILDDGRRDEVKALAERLGCRYLARPVNTHAKAGNLNYALERSRGEFIALFDADHAPRRDFLTRTLGYFLDPSVAFVQTPQDFYNLDSFQHRRALKRGQLWSEQSLFFRVIQRGKDVWNAAFFCGSCAVVRRKHMLEIGGFATGTVTEDIHTSIRLHKAGYRSVYHAESLAFGIAPQQLEPFLTQRLRWGQGAMQVWRSEGILWNRQLTLPQKLCYLASMITYFDGWQKGIYYIAPAVALLTGWLPIVASFEQFMWHFVPYLVCSLWAFSELSRGYSRPLIIEQYNMARFAVFALATLGLFRRRLSFRVTNKRMQAHAATLRMLLPQACVFALNLAAIPVGTYSAVQSGEMGWFALFLNSFWCISNLVFAYVVITFSTHRMDWQRKEYRFTIPLPVVLRLPGGKEVQAVAEDVASGGMRLVLPRAIAMHRMQRVAGALHLPGQVVPFEAVVRVVPPRARRSAVQALGVAFVWNNAEAQHHLERFLYGSDMEWVLHHLTERHPTLLERALGSAVHWHEPDERLPMPPLAPVPALPVSLTTETAPAHNDNDYAWGVPERLPAISKPTLVEAL